MPTAAPKSLAIRTYQVGFGDCFLLSFLYGTQTEKHVLIDFGTKGLPSGVPKTRMKDIAADIQQRTKGKLHAVVATHRHEDHISGFDTDSGPGTVIRNLKPDCVVQPWTEDPTLAPTATGPKGIRSAAAGHVAGLDAMHEVAAASLREIKRRSRQLSPPLRQQLAFLGENNIKNPSAVKNLMTMAKNTYVYNGSKSGLETVLPGITIHVLGPPTLKQSQAIKSERTTDPDPDQTWQLQRFWHLQAGAAKAVDSGDGKTAPLFPRFVRGRGGVFPIDARWFIYHARATSGDQLLEIVRSLDTAMNNTSVILVFEIGQTKLLFPGDAQFENWQYALSQKDNQTLLTSVNLYKVGHHGSLNATPKALWNSFKNRSKTAGAKQRLTALMSTMAGKYGAEASGTEVPRKPLVAALKSESDLFSTQDLKVTELFHETVVTF